MANVPLPDRFKALLEQNQGLLGTVSRTLSTYGEILKENRLEFFPEYTDHGIDHITQVLATSEALITPEAFAADVLGSKDIAFYTLAVLLHDLGMHLSLAGFQQLLSGNYVPEPSQPLDEKPWPQLWQEYMHEAKRWDGAKLHQMFGDEHTYIDTPPLERPNDITNKHKLLIGEFIRRHHPRLAHEIALLGFPGAGTDRIVMAEDFTSRDRNMIGLIARSHGMDLRKALNELRRLSKVRTNPGKVLVPFWMVVLRIADYLQMDATRTSETTLRTRALASPFSMSEHAAHLSTLHVYWEGEDDPERIYVEAEPETSALFLKLQGLFESIQKELDTSWAVLGEVYGKSHPQLGIRFRRIDSNLSDPGFADSVSYVPDRFRFKTHGELIKLLIAPLYGDDPAFGVRELIQNAVDACREREHLEGDEYEGLVKISVYNEGKRTYFEITDNGRGMDAEEIRDFFLTAGASYRKSEHWARAYQDELGKSKIIRNGRFGIGALAAFLLGDYLEVTTRRVDTNYGFSFSTRLNQEGIEINKDHSLPIGTRIRINLYQIYASEDFWKDRYRTMRTYGKSHLLEWYTFLIPKLEIELFNNIHRYSISHDPMPNDENLKAWVEVKDPNYDRIIWTYDKKYRDIEVSCNGIILSSPDGFHKANFPIPKWFRHPSVRILDSENSLPLQLNRVSFSHLPVFTTELVRTIFKDYLSYILINPVGLEIAYQGLEKKNNVNSNYFRKEYVSEFSAVVWKKTGFLPLCIYSMIHKLEKDILYLIGLSDEFSIENEIVKSLPENISIVFRESFKGYGGDLFRRVDELIRKLHVGDLEEVFFNDELREEIASLGKVKSPKFVSFLQKAHQLLYSHLISSGTLNKFIFIRIISDKLYPIDSIFRDLIIEYLGDDIVIPYNLEDRKKKFPKAFKELAHFMARHQ
ncbi:MAG TPA: hypothetical protein DCE41_28585 [Cytophagales bacterium]|nr:hypothetical protein [Cytophagales bacterium]HAA20954.1 hypothetical protein [Cytophagales bacterium]HAP61057.1 hypothetical protein [Cytophagales bacterium]